MIKWALPICTEVVPSSWAKNSWHLASKHSADPAIPVSKSAAKTCPRQTNMHGALAEAPKHMWKLRFINESQLSQKPGGFRMNEWDTLCNWIYLSCSAVFKTEQSAMNSFASTSNCSLPYPGPLQYRLTHVSGKRQHLTKPLHIKYLIFGFCTWKSCFNLQLCQF